MFFVRCGIFISTAWMMTASVIANLTFVSFKLSDTLNNVSFYEKSLNDVTLTSALECSCFCSQTSGCDGYNFHVTNKSCQTFSVVKHVAGRRNTACTRQEAAKKRIWKVKSRKEIHAKLTTEYLGCFSDVGKRMLGDIRMTANKMTNDLCIETCHSKGFLYAGTEHGKECFCGNVPVTHPRTPETKCNSVCYGNQKQKCGGFWKISVYKINF